MKLRIVQGFLMIELLVTILIIVSVVSVGIGYYTKILVIQKDTELYIQATAHVSEVLEKILAEQAITVHEHKKGPFTILVKPFYTLNNNEFVCIEVTASWQSVLTTPRTLSMRSGFSYQKVFT